MTSLEVARKMYGGLAHSRMITRFHIIAAEHPEWPATTLYTVLFTDEHPEIQRVMLMEFAGMKLLGEL